MTWKDFIRSVVGRPRTADFNSAIQLDPKDAAAYTNRGSANARKGDFDHAIADCDKAIQLDPNHVQAYRLRGLAYRLQGDLDHAIADYNKAIKLDPKDATAYSNRGSAYAHKQDFTAAIADYKQALEHRQTLPDGGAMVEAALAELDPKDAAAYYNRGIAYAQKKDFDRAIADFKRALEHRQTLPDGGAMAEAALVELEKRRG